ncbi:MAG: metal-dependent hydrolase [Pseudomonadota bacterium]
MHHHIEIRRPGFDFEGARPLWKPDAPEWSHMVNGASLVMPYLEPFLVRNVRDALPHIDDADLRADARGFIGQEAQHYRNHQRYNEMLRCAGYAELAAVEARHSDSYARLATRSLAWRLAYTAGFETMTMGITEWLINERAALFDGADPLVASFVLWHMVEETEHKSVALDVYRAVHGGYWLRVFGLLYGSLHVALLSRRGYVTMLKKDGRWRSLRSRLRLWRTAGRFFFRAGYAMVRALAPNHHPDDTPDPEWILRWQATYGGADKDGQPPLLSFGGGGIEPRDGRAITATP